MRRVNISRSVLSLLLVIACANVIVFAVQRWVAVPLHVTSESMEPSLNEGERILVRRSLDDADWLSKSIKRGDVIVFRSPEPGDPLVIKRVIGLPGESIRADGGIIAIDNQRVLVERWLDEDDRNPNSEVAQSVVIAETELADDEVFVLGDNRLNSIDSRSFGPVNLDRVIGREAYRFWPIDSAGALDWS